MRNNFVLCGVLSDHRLCHLSHSCDFVDQQLVATLHHVPLLLHAVVLKLEGNERFFKGQESCIIKMMSP